MVAAITRHPDWRLVLGNVWFGYLRGGVPLAAVRERISTCFLADIC